MYFYNLILSSYLVTGSYVQSYGSVVLTFECRQIFWAVCRLRWSWSRGVSGPRKCFATRIDCMSSPITSSASSQRHAGHVKLCSRSICSIFHPKMSNILLLVQLLWHKTQFIVITTLLRYLIFTLIWRTLPAISISIQWGN